MSARLAIMVFLLEEAKKRDDLEKRRQARKLRNFRGISREVDFIRHYRLSNDLINTLEQDLRTLLPEHRRCDGLSNRLKILGTLSFLATGGYQKLEGLNVETYVSQPSASRAIRQVVDALNNVDVVRKYVKFPQNYNERHALKQRFYEKFNIPGVIGCIDGTLVSIVRPKEHEERYYCRKGYHARNVLIISDADLNILHVDATFGGATHDSLVFSSSIIKPHLEDIHNSGEVSYLLGDSGYPQRYRKYLMIPCVQPESGSPEEHYNKMHSSARNSIERTIGILKGRFRCLLVHRVLHYDPIMVSKIVIACCVLHNMCNRAGLAAPAPLTTSDVEEEDRLIRTLGRSQTFHNDLASGRLSRQHLINQLWGVRSTQ